MNIKHDAEKIQKSMKPTKQNSKLNRPSQDEMGILNMKEVAISKLTPWSRVLHENLAVTQPRNLTFTESEGSLLCS
jgi:hypothetical protein